MVGITLRSVLGPSKMTLAVNPTPQLVQVRSMVIAAATKTPAPAFWLLNLVASTMDPTIQVTDIALSAIIMVAAIQPSVGTHLRMFLKALRTSLSVTRPVEISPTPVPTILTLATSVALAITESFALATQTRSEPLPRAFLAGQ